MEVLINPDSDLTILASGSLPNLIEVPLDLHDAMEKGRLRFDGKYLVDALNFDVFFVDDDGIKHITNHKENWQEIQCGFTDKLIKDGSLWRLKNEHDVYQEQYKVVDDKRQAEYTARVRPYLEEADIKKHMGAQDEYTRLMDLAVQEREKIQTENPWPTPPTN